MREDLHVGRSWEGTDLEDGCPCPKAPCGLVLLDSADPACREHPPVRAKTMRQVHLADACPGGRKTPAGGSPELHQLRRLRQLQRLAWEFVVAVESSRGLDDHARTLPPYQALRDAVVAIVAGSGRNPE